MVGRPATDINIDQYVSFTKQLNDQNNFLSKIEIADRLGVSVEVLRRFRKANAERISEMLNVKLLDQ